VKYEIDKSIPELTNFTPEFPESPKCSGIDTLATILMSPYGSLFSVIFCIFEQAVPILCFCWKFKHTLTNSALIMLMI